MSRASNGILKARVATLQRRLGQVGRDNFDLASLNEELLGEDKRLRERMARLVEKIHRLRRQLKEANSRNVRRMRRRMRCNKVPNHSHIVSIV